MKKKCEWKWKMEKVKCEMKYYEGGIWKEMEMCEGRIHGNACKWRLLIFKMWFRVFKMLLHEKWLHVSATCNEGWKVRWVVNADGRWANM